MVIISQASMPDRTHAILTGNDTRLLEVMREDAQALETLGCTCIAIPCNASHYFYDQDSVLHERAGDSHAPGGGERGGQDARGAAEWRHVDHLRERQGWPPR